MVSVHLGLTREKRATPDSAIVSLDSKRKNRFKFRSSNVDVVPPEVTSSHASGSAEFSTISNDQEFMEFAVRGTWNGNADLVAAGLERARDYAQKCSITKLLGSVVYSPILVAVMRYHDHAKVQEYGWFLLGHICYDDGRPAVPSLGEMEAAITAMNTFSSDGQVQQSAVYFLGSLLQSDFVKENPPFFKNNGLVAAVCNAAHAFPELRTLNFYFIMVLNESLIHVKDLQEDIIENDGLVLVSNAMQQFKKDKELWDEGKMLFASLSAKD